MELKEQRDLFIKIYQFSLLFDNSECSDDFAKIKYNELSSYKKGIWARLCQEVELHHISVNDIKKALVIGRISRKDVWTILDNFGLLYKIDRIYFSDQRLSEDEKVLEIFCKEKGVKIEDVFKVRKGGKSIAYSFLRNLVITPRCYIKHLDAASGGQNSDGDQVEIDNIIRAYSKEVK